jgi:acetylcholinesterase/cholinesterase
VKKCNVFIGYNSHEELGLVAFEIGDYITALRSGDFSTLTLALKRRLQIDDTKAQQIIDYYLPADQQNNANVDYLMVFEKMITDYQYECPTHTFAKLHSTYNDNVYVYLYAHRVSTSEEIYVDGAAHAEELTMTFAEPLYTQSKYGTNEKRFCLQVLSFWSNFIKYGSPSLINEWPKYTNTNSQTRRNLFYLKMNQNQNKLYDIESGLCEFWDSLNIVTWQVPEAK